MLRKSYKIIEVAEDCDHAGYFIEETVYLWKWKLYIKLLTDSEDEYSCAAFATYSAAESHINQLRKVEQVKFL